ncbi:MAG: lytic transglycosylase domain-containing protein [Pseudomonadota bacterium]
MRRSGLAFGAWLTLVATALPGAGARADIYGRTDAHGVIHLTNIPVGADYRLLVADPAAPPALAVGGIAPAEEERRARFAPLIGAVASESRIDPALLHAVVSAESAYNVQAVSRKGAKGLMQLMPATARRYGVTDPFDPLQNLRAGATYLGDLLQLFQDDLSLALAAYNAGENAVIRHGYRVPPYRETRSYVPRVLELYRNDRPAYFSASAR